MAFLIGILVGVIFVWLALKSGLYQTFALMFNLVVSVYLAIFLRPVVLGFISNTSSTAPYLNALVLFLTAAASFAILHGITFVFFTGPYNVVFPKLFDIIGAGFLGFLTGFFVWSFISLLITITPIAQGSFLKDIGFSYSNHESSNLTHWCGFVHQFAGKTNAGITVDEAIDKLLEDSKKNVKPQEPEKPVLASPPAEPATTPTTVTPLPEANMVDTVQEDLKEEPIATMPTSDTNEVNTIQKDPNKVPVASVADRTNKN